MTYKLRISGYTNCGSIEDFFAISTQAKLFFLISDKEQRKTNLIAKLQCFVGLKRSVAHFQTKNLSNRHWLKKFFIMIAGDKESGKTTLIAKLQGNEDPKKGAGLEYGYIDVRDEYRDGKTIFVKFFTTN